MSTRARGISKARNGNTERSLLLIKQGINAVPLPFIICLTIYKIANVYFTELVLTTLRST